MLTSTHPTPRLISCRLQYPSSGNILHGSFAPLLDPKSIKVTPTTPKMNTTRVEQPTPSPARNFNPDVVSLVLPPPPPPETGGGGGGGSGGGGGGTEAPPSGTSELLTFPPTVGTHQLFDATDHTKERPPPSPGTTPTHTLVAGKGPELATFGSWTRGDSGLLHPES